MTKGMRIKRLREEMSISQTDLAIKIGVSKQTLYKYENDIVTNIPSDKIELLAQALGRSEAYLMGWMENAEKRKSYTEEVNELRKHHPEINFDKIDKLVEAYINADSSIQKAIEVLLKV